MPSPDLDAGKTAFERFLCFYRNVEIRHCDACTQTDYQCDDCSERSAFRPNLHIIDEILATLQDGRKPE